MVVLFGGNCAIAQQVTFTNVADSVGVLHKFSNVINGVGLSFKDFNGDGWDDITVASGNDDSIYFFLNQGGTFQRLSPGLYAGTEAFKMVMWADYDNDGDQDLFLGGWLTPSKLLHNDGNLNFTDVTVEVGLPIVSWHTSGTSWGDYDRDGWLDKYLTMNTASAEPNLLYRSKGDGTFEEVTNSSGLLDTFLASFCSVWMDFNNDLWSDLYVANDKGDTNRMYRNLQNGNFSNYGDSSGTGIVMDAMCVTPGDYNNDGFLDIYITNTPAGGNVLFRNNGNNTFTDVTVLTGVAMHGWAWGSSWFDHDRDGDLDLYVSAQTTGAIWPSSAFYDNLSTSGLDSFDWPTGIGIDDDDFVSYSNAVGDFNNDGWIDVAVTSESPDSFMLWRNNGGTSFNWLKVFLKGTLSNRDGTGSWIHVVANGRKQVRYTMQGLGYLNQNSADEFFGIDSATVVDSLIVFWPSGIADTLLNVTPNQRLTIVEGGLPIPNPVITISGLTTFCLGESVMLDPGSWNTYKWSTGDTSQQVTVSTSGLYNVTVTNAFGVRASAAMPVDVTLLPPVNFTIISGNVTCQGNGWAQVQLTGGTAPYTYNWSNGDTTPTISDLQPGIYYVTITDANGCSKSGLRTISEPPPLANSVVMLVNPTCNGYADGYIDQTVAGGKPPYQYTWSNSDSTQDIFDLSAGTYYVTITDANACEVVDSFVITEPLGMSLSEDVSPVGCYGEQNGAVDLTVQAGIPPLSFLWTLGDTTEDITGLNAGTYAVTVTDSTGCAKSSSTMVPQPDSLIIFGSVDDVVCYGQQNGAIDISPTGGNGGFGYLWSNQQTTRNIDDLLTGPYEVTVSDSLGCTVSAMFVVTEPAPVTLTASTNEVTCFGGSDGAIDATPAGGNGGYTFVWSHGDTTEDISNLPSGIYLVTATDLKGCTASHSETILEPTEIVLSAAPTNVTCYGATSGSIDLTVSGGRGGYTFDWSNGSSGEDLHAVAAGQYYVTVSDSTGCQAQSSATVFEPLAIQITTQITDATCFGYPDGAIVLTVDGGTPAYTFAWNTVDTSGAIQNLLAGPYFVTVTDWNGCQETEVYVVGEPDSITVGGSFLDVTCFGIANGSIDLTAAGGTEPFSFTWSDSVTTQQRNALAPGSYEVTLTDKNGCTGHSTWIITEPDALQLNASATPDTSGQGTGSASVSVAGGTIPYKFFWNDPLNQITQTATGLGAGNYQVVVTDDNDCTDSVFVEVPEVTGLSTFAAPYFKVYPSPTNSHLIVSGLERNAQLAVTSTDGRLVFVTRTEHLNFVVLDVSDWTAGIYFVQVSTAQGRSGQKVVVK